jgi:predicted TIM-barrel enzyme
VLIGSGATPENISKVFNLVDGFILGGHFKNAGKADNLVDPIRVSAFMSAIKTLRADRSG